MDAVAVVARSMLDLPRVRKLNSMRLHVIENGIPPLSERIADLIAAGTAPVPSALAEFVFQAPTFVAIGRLSPEKGFELLIEAFARANSSNGELHRLLIVGEGSREKQAGAANRCLWTATLCPARRICAGRRPIARARGGLRDEFLY